MKSIGGAVHVRLGPDLLGLVDQWAALEGVTRAEAIRMLLSIAALHELTRMKHENGDRL